jgi:hypothetical protein
LIGLVLLTACASQAEKTATPPQTEPVYLTPRADAEARFVDGSGRSDVSGRMLDAEPPQDETDCVRVQATPIYQGYGWTHFVDVRNDCRKAITCDVATDIDPEPKYRVQLQPTEATRVRTRVGSNTREFRPIVECRWA